jgi:hypothetical protein
VQRHAEARAELAHEALVVIRFAAAQMMVHMRRDDIRAQLRQRDEQRGRIRAARDRGDEPVDGMRGEEPRDGIREHRERSYSIHHGSGEVMART